MEITVTCNPWSLKITILGTKHVSRKIGAYQRKQMMKLINVKLWFCDLEVEQSVYDPLEIY